MQTYIITDHELIDRYKNISISSDNLPKFKTTRDASAFLVTRHFTRRKKKRGGEKRANFLSTIRQTIDSVKAGSVLKIYEDHYCLQKVKVKVLHLMQFYPFFRIYMSIDIIPQRHRDKILDN